MTGSAAASREDRWSDVDLAFGVKEAGELPSVLSNWTAHMYDRYLAAHHLDITFGAWLPGIPAPQRSASRSRLRSRGRISGLGANLPVDVR
jgi:hypothetical protein